MDCRVITWVLTGMAKTFDTNSKHGPCENKMMSWVCSDLRWSTNTKLNCHSICTSHMGQMNCCDSMPASEMFNPLVPATCATQIYTDPYNEFTTEINLLKLKSLHKCWCPHQSDLLIFQYDFWPSSPSVLSTFPKGFWREKGNPSNITLKYKYCRQNIFRCVWGLFLFHFYFYFPFSINFI